MNWEAQWYGEPAAGALGLPLRAGAAAYGAAVMARSALYDRGLLPVFKVEARVVSVGNLTVGGAGKTPVVMHLADHLLAAGKSVAVLSRGYGRKDLAPRRVVASSRPEEVGDEPLLIHRSCPGVEVFVGADRVALARQAVAAGAQVLLLDDGMQHRRLHRDVELVVVDAQAGFGNQHLLPRGPLREPLAALSRASLLWIREATGEAAPLPLPDRPMVRASHALAGLRTATGERVPPEWLEGRELVAFCGLARPDQFFRGLAARGARLVEQLAFPDHHFFSEAELSALRAKSLPLVTTPKDAVRLPPGFPAAVVVQELQVRAGEEALRQALEL